MGLMGWIFYIFIGFILFFILSFIDNKYNITRFEKLIISIVIMMIISGFCFNYGIRYTDNIFLIFVFLLVIDIIYNSYFLSKDFFDREEKNISYYVILIIVSFIINQAFINRVDVVFLTGEDLRIILWTFALIFIYKFCVNKEILNYKSSSNKNYISRYMVLTNYAKLKDKYYDECNYTNKDISNVIYAIMIFENNRRNSILRSFDYFLFRLNGKKAKLGIMQVESSKFITDTESIEIVHKKIEKLYEKKKSGKSKVDFKDIIKDYTKENYENIVYIFDIIKKF